MLVLPRATARKLRLKIRECFRTIETGAASIGNLPDFVSEYKINTMDFEKCLILAKWGEFHFARGLSRLNEYSLRLVMGAKLLKLLYLALM